MVFNVKMLELVEAKGCGISIWVRVSPCSSVPVFIKFYNPMTFLIVCMWSKTCTSTVVYRDEIMDFASFCTDSANFEMIDCNPTSCSLDFSLAVQCYGSVSSCDGDFSSNLEVDGVSSFFSFSILDGGGGLDNFIFFLACVAVLLCV